MKNAFGKYIDFKLLKNNDKELKSLKLYEVCEISRGKRITKNQLVENGTFDVISGGIKPMGKIDKYNQESNTITIAQYGMAGFVNYQTKRFWANDVCYCLKPKEEIILNKYLYYFLKGNQHKIYNISNRNAIPFSIEKEKILQMSISIPSLEKQKEIVNILDKFTELETELETELDLRNLQYDYYLNSLLDFSNNEMLLKNIMNLNSKEKLDTNVKRISLSEIFVISRGKIYSKEYIKDNPGKYPVYSSQTANDGILGKINTYDYDGEYITWTTDGQYAGTVFYRNNKFSITNICGILKPKNSKVMSIKYLSYLLKITFPKYVNRSTSNYKLMSNVVENIRISIPSLEIQNKIANILDKLETYTKDIKTGLPLEIKQRKEQFDYYHEMLLTFDDILERERERELSSSFIELLNMLEWKLMLDLTEYKLSDIFEIFGGFTPLKTDKSNWNNGSISWFTLEDLRINGTILNSSIEKVAKARKIFPKNSIILSRTASIGNHALITTDFVCNDQLVAFYLKEEIDANKINIKFMYYLFFKIGNLFRKQKRNNSLSFLKMNEMKNFPVSIPSIQIQNKIVEILDKLEIYAKDIKEGLPKEINLRKKQYKYYLNKLLDLKN
ncbi:restriction endonuclease subunit S [Metamycoplasma gateae]|uniref:Restriction endonuclease subunit S n=1 Tax=Metamycoplasma gateae TaxID=35769 RepID=A0ABZ2AJF7_9BACT|nr:restriction endonuclease subunit S [Metamycoplasma gateae]